MSWRCLFGHDWKVQERVPVGFVVSRCIEERNPFQLSVLSSSKDEDYYGDSVKLVCRHCNKVEQHIWPE